jgi:hypothetical protein
MPIFSKLFGSSKRREVKNIFAETNKQVQEEYKPLGELGKAIIQASVNCHDVAKRLINAPSEKERQQREIFVFYEFIYFYIHLTLRHAFGNLTKEQTQKLQDYLGPLISSVAIDSYFAHWPEHLKEKMTDEFYQKLNDAELEYSECTDRIQFDSSKEKQERIKDIFKALFLKLSFNVANLVCNDENNLALIAPVMEVAMNEWIRMRLDKLIADVKRAG